MQTSFIECMLYLLSPNKFMQRIGEDEEEVLNRYFLKKIEKIRTCFGLCSHKLHQWYSIKKLWSEKFKLLPWTDKKNDEMSQFVNKFSVHLSKNMHKILHSISKFFCSFLFLFCIHYWNRALSFTFCQQRNPCDDE